MYGMPAFKVYCCVSRRLWLDHPLKLSPMNHSCSPYKGSSHEGFCTNDWYQSISLGQRSSAMRGLKLTHEGPFLFFGGIPFQLGTFCEPLEKEQSRASKAFFFCGGFLFSPIARALERRVSMHMGVSSIVGPPVYIYVHVHTQIVYMYIPPYDNMDMHLFLIRIAVQGHTPCQLTCNPPRHPETS